MNVNQKAVTSREENEMNVNQSAVTAEEAEAMNKNQSAVTAEEENAMNKNQSTVTAEEGEAMNENQSAVTAEEEKAMDVNKVLDEMLSGNIEDLIPEEERAVTDMENIQRNMPVVVNTIMPLKDITTEIPEEEREVPDKNLPELPEATRCGLLSPVSGMKGFELSTGHMIYAQIYTDSKGNRIIKYRQKYKNDSYSEEMEIQQADLLNAATYQFTVERAKHSMFRNKIAKFLMNAYQDYQSKLRFTKEYLDITVILNLLLKECDELPVMKSNISILNDKEKLYKKILQIIKEKKLDIVDEHESYYTLDKEQLEILVQELNVKRTPLLRKLQEYDFLYLTESSDGYQAYVRFKPYGEFFPKEHTQWCYCILKAEYLAKKRIQRGQG